MRHPFGARLKLGRWDMRFWLTLGRFCASIASRLITGITLLLAIGPPNGSADLEI